MDTLRTPYDFHRNLSIGEVIVSEKKEEIIWTVLGSCISVIFHVEGVVSIISHSQLPYNSFNHECTEDCPQPCGREFDSLLDNRYVKCSLGFMIGKLAAYGFDPRRLKTTIVGGASIVKYVDGQESIGDKNVAMAKTMLAENGIRLNRQKTGGLNGYNIWYHTDTDRLFVRTINEGHEPRELFGV
jgi:chemotaxis protein CheD